MPWTEEEIFAAEEIVEPALLASEHRFSLPGILTIIKVRIYRQLKAQSDMRFEFETSHLIHTPEQIGPYSPSAPWCDDADYALHRAVESIVSYYKAAVRNGHKPSVNWLVPNDFF
jgi:hypothetical protein